MKLLSLLKSPLLWVSIFFSGATYMGFRIWFERPDFTVLPGPHDVSSPGGLAVFLLVFCLISRGRKK